MPNSRHTSVIASPSSSRDTNRRRSSITEHSFHGIDTSRLEAAESVTHVSGTFCHPCLGSLKTHTPPFAVALCHKSSFVPFSEPYRLAQGADGRSLQWF